MPEYPRIISIVSVVIGAVFLFASAFFLDDWREWHSNCKSITNWADLCSQSEHFVVGASFGIIVSLVQLLTIIPCHLEKWRIWSIIHIVLCVLSIIAFSVPMAKDAHSNTLFFGGICARRTARFFLALAGIDIIFTLAAAAAVFFLTK